MSEEANEQARQWYEERVAERNRPMTEDEIKESLRQQLDWEIACKRR